MDTTEKLNTLKTASEGLLYPSESDEPFVPFRWKMVQGETAEAAVERNAKANGPIESVESERFFDELKASDDAEGFDELREALERALPGHAVVRAGKTRVSVYLIGAGAGDWIGLETKSVET
jgi:hypothetical protein